MMEVSRHERVERRQFEQCQAAAIFPVELSQVLPVDFVFAERLGKLVQAGIEFATVRKFLVGKSKLAIAVEYFSPGVGNRKVVAIDHVDAMARSFETYRQLREELCLGALEGQQENIQ